jgi:hypothetical protein
VRLLLDGQQRLTSLSAVIRGQSVTVRGRRRPIELLFNLEHPDKLAVVTEVEEDGDDDDDSDDSDQIHEDEADSTEDELQQRFNKMTFVVATKKLGQLPQWVKVSEVFKSDSDAPFLKNAKQAAPQSIWCSNIFTGKCLRNWWIKYRGGKLPLASCPWPPISPFASSRTSGCLGRSLTSALRSLELRPAE